MSDSIATHPVEFYRIRHRDEAGPGKRLSQRALFARIRKMAEAEQPEWIVTGWLRRHMAGEPEEFFRTDAAEIHLAVYRGAPARHVPVRLAAGPHAVATSAPRAAHALRLGGREALRILQQLATRSPELTAHRSTKARPYQLAGFFYWMISRHKMNLAAVADCGPAGIETAS